MQLHLMLATLALGSSLIAQEEKIALDIAFVGDVATRTDDFVKLLGERFRAVRPYAHDASPDEIGKADVVVLDWQQKVDAIAKWSKDPEARAKACPLGARATWRTPTVLLGSAGLNLACAWDVKGGFG